MRILRAKTLGMCFGVRDAIDLAIEQAQQGPLTIFGELVHNDQVMDALREDGISVQSHPDLITTSNVMITAHGTSQKATKMLLERGFQVKEATCPLVHHAHRMVKKLVDDGFHPIIIGQRNHVEVRGLTGDLAAYDVVLTEQDVLLLEERRRFGVAAQTTQPIERVAFLVDRIRQRFPKSEVVFHDTVCQPTKQRQAAAVELAKASDVVIVVGGKHSNNTRELVATCRRHCPWVHHVQNAGEMEQAWLRGHHTIGLTAGTSTPEQIIDEVEAWLERTSLALTHSLEANSRFEAHAHLVPTL